MDLETLPQWYDFTGKTAMITGGTGVLGSEMACALVGLGANVAVLDCNTNLLERYKEPMNAGPGKYMVVYGDVLKREGFETAVYGCSPLRRSSSPALLCPWMAAFQRLVACKG